VFNGHVDFNIVRELSRSSTELVLDRRLARICHSIACTIAKLAYAVAR
jgi:hypothetical protein